MFRLGVGHPRYNLSGKFIVYSKIKHGIRVYNEDSSLVGCNPVSLRRAAPDVSKEVRWKRRGLQQHTPEDLNLQPYGRNNQKYQEDKGPRVHPQRKPTHGLATRVNFVTRYRWAV